MKIIILNLCLFISFFNCKNKNDKRMQKKIKRYSIAESPAFGKYANDKFIDEYEETYDISNSSEEEFIMQTRNCNKWCPIKTYMTSIYKGNSPLISEDYIIERENINIKKTIIFPLIALIPIIIGTSLILIDELYIENRAYLDSGISTEVVGVILFLYSLYLRKKEFARTNKTLKVNTYSKIKEWSSNNTCISILDEDYLK
ncbi:MAG: hypothetical protein GY830_06775 [Bacteroidetes bacterium]|nr:hypothetical protein [Bacteroidota bacterium]